LNLLGEKGLDLVGLQHLDLDLEDLLFPGQDLEDLQLLDLDLGDPLHLELVDLEES